MSQDLWKRLCEDFDYRFFSGVPFKEAEYLYSSMDPKIMHYIPASNKDISVNLCSGVWLSGLKSGVILSPKNVIDVDLKFNLRFNIPILIMTSENVDVNKKFFCTDNIAKVVSYIEKKLKPAVLFI